MLQRALTKGLFSLALAFVLAGLTCPRARADVGIVLNESLGVSMDRISGTGHSAVYFSRICPESPVKLRLCRPDENGSVMSNYINIGEPQDFEWNIVPLNIYLYGLENPRFRPLLGTYAIKDLLEERYRAKYLQGYCDGPPCSTSSKAEWREMVGATLIRGMYVFAIDTTVEQDKALIAQFNAAPNQNHFNGITRNCANFTKRVINTYFPHAASADYLNDFGMTTPKAIARSFVRFAAKNPELNLRVLHFAQVPGTIKRSSDVRSVTEQLYRSKKLLIPMLIFADYGVPAVAASYLLTGRFNPEREFEKRPGQAENSGHRALPSKAQEEEQAEIVGTSAEWKKYRQELNSLLGQRAETDGTVEPEELQAFFKHVSKVGKPRLDSTGAVWIEVKDKDQAFQVGLSANNILGRDSDTASAYALLLWRAQGVLKSPKHRRETMPEFEDDWELLQQARLRNAETAAKDRVPEKQAKAGVASAGGNDD
ncbi:MAG TPA: hypothetical protein VJN89_12220 [Candidatus Acidoferrum sp.]|nr:hypothetical protein [Candidatus Acidoferrum sp.]